MCQRDHLHTISSEALFPLLALTGVVNCHQADNFGTFRGFNDQRNTNIIRIRQIIRGSVQKISVSGSACMSSDDNDREGGDRNGGPDTGLATKEKPKTKKPAMYKVIMLNDDYTPMEFVVLVLQEFFRKSQEEATNIMLHVHQRGVGVCGVYTYEVAETKATQVMELARKNQHPLQLQLEKE